ncbi:MAG TPA: hypothetical protein VMM12_13380 [Longimicrobiales bacterium]|nr:hypothetical protein [Longimicrobiales bacterium]
MTHRGGAVSLPELVLVFWGFALVLLALAGFVSGQGRIVRHQQGLVRVQEARRAVEIILGRELRAVAPADVGAAGTHQLDVRAVRGSGALCAVTDREVEIAYVGARRPDAEKDSVVLAGETVEEVLPILSVAGAGCGGSGVTLLVDRAPSVRRGFALVFEPGSYQAADAAIRYRIGRGGRQPLTEAFFADAAFEPMDGAAAWRLALRPDPDSLPPSVLSPIRLRIPSLNTPAW